MGTGIVDKLKQEFPLEDSWVSYEIHPGTPASGVLLETLFGPGLINGQRAQRERCEELGLPFEGPRVLVNSRLVIEASEFARDAGKHGEFHRAALAAYFAASRNIGSLEVLVEVAAEVGLDPAALGRDLATGRYVGRRENAREEACALEITAVPTFIFAGETKVVGARPLDDFRRLLENLVEIEARRE